MKIVLCFSVGHSTVSEYYLTVANELVMKGHKVYVLTDKQEAHPFFVDKRIVIRKWPSTRPTRFKDFLFAWRFFLAVRPQVVVSMFSSVNVSLLASLFAGVKRRIVWIHTISTAFQNDKLLLKRRAKLLKLATDIVANSEANREDLEVHFRVRPEKITVLQNALSDPKTQSASRPNVIFYAGRLLPEKGVDLLLSAMPEVIRQIPEARLEIAGGRLGFGKIKHYSEQCAQLGISDHVTFLGSLRRDLLLERFAAAYVTVFPSAAEGFGLVAIESFAAATPVIGADNTSIPEIIRDGKDGLLFETGNRDDLAQKIISLLKNPSLRQQMSVTCRQRFLDTFNTDSVAKKVASFLTEK